MPGGELLDTVRAKRVLVATAVVTVALSSLIFRLWPIFPTVALAQVLQGITGGVLGPGVVAITLGLVGHAALAERLGQNQRFAAAWLPRESVRRTRRSGPDHCAAVYRGEQAEKHGRKPLLLVGFGALPIRAVLFILTSNPLAS